MPTFGSDGGFQANNRGGIIDEQGNTIISADDSFGASPLGVAARTQALYGIPNANFNLTPPDPSAPIVPNQNDLPYWAVTDESGGDITATSVFDATTQTYGVEINPGTADTGSIFKLSTRSYLLTDDNLALRQKAQAVLAKSGTAAGTSQWNLTLDCVYYDANDTALSTAVIGTALDTGTWTSLAGTTTPGGSAINAAAQYVDLTFTLTTTAEVTGSAKATIKSLLLTTSVAGGGGSQSFLVADTYTASDTWTRPTGVDYLVAVIGIGAGGGGGGGGATLQNTTSNSAGGGGGGGAGAHFILRDLYVGDQSSISVGVGAGGAGGTAATITKAAAGTASYALAGGTGADGGVTTFGSYFSMATGKGGPGNVTSNTAAAGGARAGNATTIVYGGTNVLGGGGGIGARDNANAGAGTAGGFTNFDYIPYNTPGSAAGEAGGIGSGTATAGGSVTLTTAVAAGTAGWISGGGGGGGVTGTSATFRAAGASQKGGGGSGGGAIYGKITTTTTISGTAGNGGNGGANVGGGGGGGGGATTTVTNTLNGTYAASTVTLTSGAGGQGSDGFVSVIYIA